MSPARPVFLACLAWCCLISSASAQDFWDDTHLLDFRIEWSRWETARSLGDGGYELSNGDWVSFEDWYDVKRPPLTVQFLTSLRPDLGLIWGITTGSRAEKIALYPGVQLGLIHQRRLGPGYLTLSASTLIGGSMREKTCTADYGDIGGIQQVNCRLAADILAPEDTLDYLVNVKGIEESRISLVYEMRF